VREVHYDPRLPIFWTLDFNVNPMVSLIGQRDGNRSMCWTSWSSRIKHLGSVGGISSTHRTVDFQFPLGVSCTAMQPEGA